MSSSDSTRNLPRARGALSRFVTIAVTAAFLAACQGGRTHSGKEPEGDRRPYPTVAGAPTKRNVASKEPKTGSAGGRHVESPSFFAVVGTPHYHAQDCKRLEGVPEKDRLPFLSGYDGLDAGYFPCDLCKPGP